MTIQDLQRIVILEYGDEQYEILMKDLVEALKKAGFIVKKERIHE